MSFIWWVSVMMTKCSIVEGEDMTSADLRAFKPWLMLMLPQTVIAIVIAVDDCLALLRHIILLNICVFRTYDLLLNRWLTSRWWQTWCNIVCTLVLILSILAIFVSFSTKKYIMRYQKVDKKEKNHSRKSQLAPVEYYPCATKRRHFRQLNWQQYLAAVLKFDMWSHNNFNKKNFCWSSAFCWTKLNTTCFKNK